MDTTIIQFKAELQNADETLRSAAKLAIDIDRFEDVARLLNVLTDLRTIVPPNTSSGAPTRSPDQLNEYEKGLVRRKLTIDAIKAHRNRTGFGLKESKDVVVAYRDTLSPEDYP
jgi:hypothetical protein